MEKRLFTAIILSLLVLYVWVGLTQPMRRKPPTSTQAIETNELTTELDLPPEPKQPPEEESPLALESQKLTITFSSKGAAIVEAHIKDYGVTLPVQKMGIPSKFEDMIFSVEKPSERSVRFTGEFGGTRINVQYDVSENDYIVEQKVSIQGSQEMSKLDKIDLRALTVDTSRMDNKDPDYNRDKSLFEYVVNAYSGILRKNNAFKFDEKEEKRVPGHVVWAGFRDRYYCAIFRPQYESLGYKVVAKDSDTLDIDLEIDPAGERVVNLSSVIFIGPEKYDVLKGYDLGLEKIKRFYRIGLFDIIAMVIYRLMNLIHKIIPNWGASIILISSLIYLSMYPLTLRGMSSMKRMQALQPEINKLKEKHSDNPQKMNQEMMRLYKEYKINPLGGCLPFLLQMPIFIGLYQVLWRSVSFKGANFLWIKDLSLPDRFYTLPVDLPFIGREINLLPLLMMIVMFFQQRITAKNMVVTDPMQLQQQKMMGIFMPVMLGVIFYKFASGLTLYFTVFYLFSTFTQLHMYKAKKVSNEGK